MENFFDDFDGEFDDGEPMDDDSCEDYSDDGMDDDGMEGTADPDPDNDVNHEDDQSDEFTWDEAYWSGVGLGFAYEEGRRERRKRRKNSDSNEPSDID